jgi:hypothetical protein
MPLIGKIKVGYNKAVRKNASADTIMSDEKPSNTGLFHIHSSIDIWQS